MDFPWLIIRTLFYVDNTRSSEFIIARAVCHLESTPTKDYHVLLTKSTSTFLLRDCWTRIPIIQSNSMNISIHIHNALCILPTLAYYLTWKSRSDKKRQHSGKATGKITLEKSFLELIIGNYCPHQTGIRSIAITSIGPLVRSESSPQNTS